MNTEITVALISAVPSLIVAGTSIYANNRVLGYKVDELRKDVEKHNGVVERMAVVERDLKTAFNLIDDNKDEIRQMRDK